MNLPEGPWDVMVVDPPWSYGATNNRSSAEKHYPTLRTIEEIAAVAPVGGVAAADSVLYLWVTNPKMKLGFDLMRAYGFDYKTMVTWVKVTKGGYPHVGMGFYYRGCTEHVLVGTRGRYAIPPELREPNVLLARRGEHSAKPHAFYEMVERTSPDQRRLDVFARTTRAGWASWGNEVCGQPETPASLSGSSESEPECRT